MTPRSRPARDQRVGENHRPPRYRLLAAAAALPVREHVEPSQSFEAECPACRQVVEFTQVHGDSGAGYVIAEHGCVERADREA